MKAKRLGLLYHKYIKDGPLERQNWNAERLGTLLEAKGFIKITRNITESDQFIELKKFGHREVRSLTRSYPRTGAITSEVKK